MGKTLNEHSNVVDKAEIVHHGEAIVLPNNMTIPKAITLLKRREEHLQTEVDINDSFDVFPWDGAYALQQVLADTFGWADNVPTPGMFGSTKPQMISVETAYGIKEDVMWGRFTVPTVSGHIQTGVSRGRSGRVQFTLSATVLRKDELTVKDVFSKVRKYLKEHSIYRGKAIKMRFRDDKGNLLEMPEPQFIDTASINPDGLIFSEELTQLIKANLFTPIRRVHDCIANGIKVKRGVLLGGVYGTGKTLAATVASRVATDVGVTYVYTPHASELADAIEFAKQYQSPACVVFCEDIDREVTGDRSVEMDDILNILDGIDTKTCNIMTVLTTNHLENINQAMLRPGRLDAIIDVTPPDAEAAERLVRLYGADAISADEDLTEVGQILEGKIPAVIEEVVKRAKLYQLDYVEEGAKVTDISNDALKTAALTMTSQIELLSKREAPARPTVEGVLGDSTRAIVEGALKPLRDSIDSIEQSVG